MRRSTVSQEAVREARQRVLEAFRQLRRKGIVARANYLCCTSCASYALHETAKQRPKAIGYAYWHQQNEEEMWRSGELYIGFAAVDDEDPAHMEIGQRVVAELKKQGLEVEWPEDPDIKIKVVLVRPETEPNQ